MKFSIITCTWNSETTLAQTIDSVKSQTGVEVEHIFVDGGSEDRTLEIVRSAYRAPTILNGIRGGISNAMNSGISIASGDVIAHLHADDYYLTPDVLTKVKHALESSGNMWAYGKIRTLRGNKLSEPNISLGKFSKRELARANVTIPHPATFVRREVFHELGGFDLNLRYAMDIDMWHRIATRYQPAAIDDALTAFRHHMGSLSSSQPQRARLEEILVRMRHIQSYGVDGLIGLARTSKKLIFANPL